jgi:hypothetical protein
LRRVYSYVEAKGGSGRIEATTDWTFVSRIDDYAVSRRYPWMWGVTGIVRELVRPVGLGPDATDVPNPLGSAYGSTLLAQSGCDTENFRPPQFHWRACPSPRGGYVAAIRGTAIFFFKPDRSSSTFEGGGSLAERMGSAL